MTRDAQRRDRQRKASSDEDRARELMDRVRAGRVTMRNDLLPEVPLP